MGTPNISVRRYVRWLPSEPHEPTSTLVLTSSAGKYVDIRILTSETVRETSDQESDSASLSLDRLEWAFAGSTTRVPSHEKDGKFVPTHARWHHWIDSRAGLGDELHADEGDMFPQENGEELETGRMVNPATGVLTDYEEMWSDAPVDAMPEITLQGTESYRTCVVLTHEQADGSSRGMIVRIGQWCQGILRDHTGLTLERWKFGDEKWKLMARIGQGDVPCTSTFEAEKLIAGNKFFADDVEWCVDEITKW